MSINIVLRPVEEQARLLTRKEGVADGLAGELQRSQDPDYLEGWYCGIAMRRNSLQFDASVRIWS